MARLKPLDAWGVNNEVLSVGWFQRFLRITRGLEGPREGVEVSAKYKTLLPYFVLGGLQGLRTCEMVRERADYPAVEWRDFLWNKKLLVVRDEVAKQTRARVRLRYVPLEPASSRGVHLSHAGLGRAEWSGHLFWRGGRPRPRP
jgi:hypothetical protein